MRTIKIKLYKFKELKKKAQEYAIEHNRDWNTDHDWWDSVYEDAQRIGLTITSFDCDRREITGDLTMTAMDSIKAIFEEHGEPCATYQTATKHKSIFQCDTVKRRALEDEDWEQEDPDLVDDYKKELLRDYLKMLDEEYDYLSSDESVGESLEANECEFTEGGELQ